MTHISRYKHWLFFVFLALQMFLTFLPGNALPLSPFSGLDKIIHLSMYTVFSSLLCFFLRDQRKNTYISENWFLLSFALVFLYALFEETLQGIVSGRSPDIYDLYADVVGAFVGIFLFKRITLGTKKKKLNHHE